MSRQQQKELLELAVQSVQVSKQLTLSRKPSLLVHTASALPY